MNNSPWAKFTTSMMPKISVSPEAISARIMPVTMPFTVWMMHEVEGNGRERIELIASIAHTPRYCLMTGSLTSISDAAQWWRTLPFSMM